MQSSQPIDSINEKATIQQDIYCLDKRIAKIKLLIKEMECNSIDVGLAALESINGIALLSFTRSELDYARNSQEKTGNPTWVELRKAQDRIIRERLALRMKLYELEKEETLFQLERHVEKESPLYHAIKEQFVAIDDAIKTDKFSKTYIDVAINTRKIIAPNDELERFRAIDRHITITTKKSVSTVVAGCMLLLAGLLVVAFACTLVAVFSEALPVALLGGGIIGGVGIAIMVDGAKLIKSGLPRKRPPLVKQSLFNVAEKACPQPKAVKLSEPIYTNAYLSKP